ncbi:transcription antitermination factor NusB [uncultured Lamprocystis sp.]|jgi:N utilization substance protein B|uniref:transcription antitermination factor NusB n=1 Tax=uncultured Lamprocystis sp. TaxID=543132 RepID=UPI0025E5EF2E|nr:transcription antitermination factor NusB [uncultured Lamprocystis sp.]
MAKSTDRGGVSPRSQARRYAALALYQWHLTREEPATIRQHMLDDPEWLDALVNSLNGAEDDTPVDPKDRFNFNLELFDSLVKGVPAEVTAIDAALDGVLDRPISQVDPVELAILRIGAYEILFSPAIPAGVAINEAVELTKLLGAHEGHRYVNGVLDKVARRAAAASR